MASTIDDRGQSSPALSSGRYQSVQALCEVLHPHSRGEHIPLGTRTTSSAGSSPLAWGTRYIFFLFRYIFRFIPTRVGNTPDSRGWRDILEVHPHSRGEHTHTALRTGRCIGSSPLAWGTHTPLHQLSSHTRFIPTRVGNTACRPSASGYDQVHPHSRGEHANTMESAMPWSSSRQA